jgi:stage V sporulation protein G
MQLTNVTVKLSPQSGDRLKAFCTMTLDNEFVVRDLKIIEGTSGLFVAMPSRKLTDHCPKCGGKNHLRAKHCNDCGARLPEHRVSDEDAQGKLHADVAHPINSECRGRIQDAIIAAYQEELRKAGREGEARTAAAGEAGDFVEAEEAPPAAEVPGPETPPAETPQERPPAEGGKAQGFGEGIL